MQCYSPRLLLSLLMTLLILPHIYRHYSKKNLSATSSFFKPLSSSILSRCPGPMDPTTTNTTRRLRKVVLVMGPTGAGKSKLSIDLARFYPQSEVINSDKIQVYAGLDISTNKITMQDRLGVPHHHLGTVDPTELECTASEYRSTAASTISDITSRRCLPLVVGGSNSFIYALLTKHYDPDSDVFNGLDPVSSELRYSCCFLWIDVDLKVLNQYLSKRVDEMLDSGMFEELTEFYESGGYESVNRAGLGKAIGLPEFERYFKMFHGRNGENDGGIGKLEYEESVKAIKENTFKLARRQVEKIQRLKDGGWDLHKIDGTEAFRAALGSEEEAGKFSEIWEKKVVEPSVKIVKQFLEE